MAKTISNSADGLRQKALAKQAGIAKAKAKAKEKAREKARAKQQAKYAALSPSEARLARRADDDKIIKRVKLVFVGAVAAAVIGLAAGLFLFINRPPFATVGGDKITEADYSYALHVAHGNMSNATAAGMQYTEEMVRSDAFQSCVDLKVFSRMAREQGVTLTDEDLATIQTELYDTTGQMNSMALSAAANGMTVDAFSQMAYGMSVKSFESYYKKGKLASKVLDNMAAAVTVTDEEALSIYEADPATYNNASIFHVLFLYEGPDAENPRTREESLSMAEAALARAQGGEDMSTLAQELSEDTGVTSNFGYYQFTENGAYDPAFLEWTFSTPNVGDFGIVESTYGYHVMKLESRNNTFDAVKAALIESLQYERAETEFNGLKADPKYEVLVDQELYDQVYNDKINEIHEANAANAASATGDAATDALSGLDLSSLQ